MIAGRFDVGDRVHWLAGSWTQTGTVVRITRNTVRVHWDDGSWTVSSLNHVAKVAS